MSFGTYLYDLNMAIFERACLKSWRRELLKHVYGEVLEVGAGTGANIDHYSDQVTRLVLTEPDKHMRKVLERNVSNRGLENIQVSDGTAQQIRAEDESFDCVVSSLVCGGSPILETAVEEIKRVLKPGGKFVFLEHAAAAEGTSTRRWQDRINPIWRIWWSLNPETEKAIITAGFEIREITRENVRRTLPILGSTIRGIAVKKPNKGLNSDGLAPAD
jgi:ubiquinone/menaquinone biosynthesis C-methylase UbiE